VIDEATYKPLSGARVFIAPAGHSGALVATTDRLGSFAFSGLPVVDSGFDFTVTAAGYRTSREEHEKCYPGGFAVGDWSVTRTSASAGR
jgi:Carboxypeptidase regulatory-like domain